MMSAPAELCLLACLFLGAGFSLASGASQTQDFTFVLPAGRAECFYQTAAKSDSVEVNYQVLAGTGLDVGFTFLSPRGGPLARDLYRSDGIHIVEAAEDGDYEFCFDNSFSQMSHKMVFFVVTINSQSSVGGDGGGWADVAETESLAEYRLEDIRAKMDSVHRNLESSRQAQAALRAFETRDRYLLEDNLWRVSFWSCVNLLIMLAVAVTQIYTLRRLFDDKKRVRT